MGYKLKTAPAAEPVSLTEAKLHLRVDTDCTDDDNLITALIAAAREMAENYTGRAFISQTWELTLDNFPVGCIELRPAPLATITSITYQDGDGVVTTLSTSIYEADTYSTPGRACNKWALSWPTAREIQNSILVTYTTGYGATSAAVPGPIKAAILLTIGHLYEHRESVVVGVTAQDMPHGAEYLLNPYRVIEM